MAFPNNTYLDIIKYLNLSIEDRPRVKTALLRAEEDPELEVEIINMVVQISSIEAALLEERSSPNSAMIRADVVEWQPGARTQGMTTALRVLKRRLGNLLGIEYKSSSYGGTTSISTRTIY